MTLLIKTNRFILRPIELKDRDQVFNYRSDAEVNKYQGWIPKSPKEVEAFIDKNPQTFNLPGTWFQLVIESKETKEVVGDIGIHFIDNEKLQCELGCTISKDHMEKGIATEVLTAVLDYLFNHLKKHRITASIDPRNKASVKLFEKLGFRKEAHHKESIQLHGEWVDDVIFAMLINDFENKSFNQKATFSKPYEEKSNN